MQVSCQQSVFLSLVLLINYFHKVYGVCPSDKLLDLKDADPKWICSASRSFPGMGCQNLFDKDYFTYWHPGGKGTGIRSRVSLHLSNEIEITGIKIYQHKWVSGFASEISVYFDNDNIAMKADKKHNFVWNRQGSAEGKKTKSVSIEIVKVYGGIMGSFREIQFMGCHKNSQKRLLTPESYPYSTTSAKW